MKTMIPKKTPKMMEAKKRWKFTLMTKNRWLSSVHKC